MSKWKKNVGSPNFQRYCIFTYYLQKHKIINGWKKVLYNENILEN